MQPTTRDSASKISLGASALPGWILTGLLSLVPVILWFQIHPLSTINGFSGIMLSLGRLTGLIGVVLYALNLVYATRLRFLENLFGGLNRVYIAHHIIGGLALVFLCFHPLFLAGRYVTTSVYQSARLLLPTEIIPLSALFDTAADNHEVVKQELAIALGSMAFWGMVGLLVVAFFVRLPYRIWLFSHKFLGFFFFLAGLHVVLINSDTSSSQALKVYILGMIALGIAAFIFRTLMPHILVRRLRYRVSSVRADADGTVHTVFLDPAGTTLPFRPGQFIFIRFLGAEKQGINKEWHPFSLASSPKDRQLRVSVKALGDFTRSLAALPAGTAAEVEGAFGRFSYTHFKNKKQVWVAGGIGVTPFLSMAASLDGQDYDITLIYSVKSRAELIDVTALQQAVKRTGGRLKVAPYVVDEQKSYLDVAMIKKLVGRLDDKEVFLCGPPPMMKSLREQLRRSGVKNRQIHSEEFSMS